jgi:hypothetical protein
MRRILSILVLLCFCTIVITPVFAEATSGKSASDHSPGGYITRSYNYILDGNPGTVSLALSTKLQEEYRLREAPWYIQDNSSYFLSSLNDMDQRHYIEVLADGIRAETQDPDDQARIATSLVQHITYEQGTAYRYPYEILYEGSGVCGEKSILLAALLRELGSNASVMYFVPENHMTAGISCPAPFDFQGSGYCMIETTHGVIITDDTSFQSDGIMNWSVPEITQTSEGISFTSAKNDYYDARSWIALQAESKASREAGKIFPTVDKQRWYQLQSKYDLT